MSAVLTAPAAAVAGIRHRRARRGAIVTASLVLAVAVTYAVTLMIGNTVYTPAEVWRVILGETVPGASFTVGELRLPRATLAVLAGLAFGLAGVTFQTMLRNPLAAPDIIGITSGASAAAVVGIVFFSLSGLSVSLVALAGGLLTALVIAGLSSHGTFSGTRLILMGIGVAAMLDAVITYALSQAAAWDLQTAMRWLTGSLNGATWSTVAPLAIAAVVLVPTLLAQSRNLELMRLGDDAAAGLGVAVTRVRLILLLAAVALLAMATAATGPIAFVAFMAGPIAARLRGAASPSALSAGLVGALLVLVADLVGQFAFDGRYPVGVVTGAVGAPFLIFLLIRTQRSGGSL